MSNKYELVKNMSIEVNGKKLYRIRSLKDFGNIKKSTIGGYVESEKNLSQDGACWIADNARVYENAVVSENALVTNSSHVFGHAKIFGNAIVNGIVSGYADIFEDETYSDSDLLTTIISF